MSDNIDKQQLSADEALLARVEKQLDEIETSEILRDMTPEALAEKGFIGDKPVDIGSSVKAQVTEKEHLLFEPGVEFERLADTALFESIGIESLSHIADVEKGQLIASRNAEERIVFEAGNNITVTISGERVRYHARVRGKPIIIKDILHLVPSDVDCKITIRVDEEKMHAYLDCSPAHGDGKPLTTNLVCAELERQGITHGINRTVITEAIGNANETKSAVNILIAEGSPPLPGKPGAIEFTFDSTPREYDFTILPDGRIDYRNSKAILTAVENQLLARIGQASAGVPGKTVLGESLPVEDAEAAAATIIPGNGIRVSEDGKAFFAAISGIIMLNGSTLDVVNMYVVEGDVDFTTGNISFNGSVFVRGTVLDGFEVKADGDIIVQKIVESARLVAGRDVIVKGGVLGRGKGLVSAGRDIRIGYAQNARLEAQGNIYIGNYAVNSYIATSKQLIMLEKRGSVIGGEVFALRGIDVRTLGSESGIKTHIEAGTDYLVLRTLNEMDGVISFCEQNIRKIDEALKALAVKLKPGAPLPQAMKQPMVKALEKKRDLERRMATVQAKRADLRKASLEKDRCFVKVKDTCHPDVSITIKELKTVVAKSRDHVRFYDDRKTGEIGVGAY
jgi:uncharacterized protein (DUF342 family)